MTGALQGRVAIITGAGSGLGKAYAEHAAAEGAAVLVNDLDLAAARTVASAITADGGTAAADGHSVAEWDGAASLVAAAVARFGRIDGLVNNAGVLASQPSWTADESVLRHVLEVNLLGPLFCGRHALPHMVTRRNGSIVNIGSATQNGLAGSAAYCASKGGVAALTASWSLELAAYGVRINTVIPSARTPQSTGGAGSTEFRAGPEWAPSGVAPLISYLLSGLSAGITGQTFRMARGQLATWTMPAPAMPPVSQQAWSVIDVAAAVADLAIGFSHPGLPVGDPAVDFVDSAMSARSAAPTSSAPADQDKEAS